MSAGPRNIVFVSAAPLNADFPGGFARRDRALVAEIARKHPTEVVFVTDDPDVVRTAPGGVATRAVPTCLARRDLLSPRQCVGARLPPLDAALVVPLTPNVAHLARGHRSVVLIEEGWERALTPPGPGARAVFSSAVERGRFRHLYRSIGRQTEAVVAITERERLHLSKFIESSRVVVVPFGVDLDFFSPRQERSDFDVAIIGAVNRREQRVEEFVGQLVTLRPEARIAIVGGLPRPSVQALASPTVTVTGYAPDVRPFYARSSVVAVPTSSDIGVKTTMLEAWAMGRAVAATSSVAGAVPLGPAVTAPTPELLADVVADLLGSASERERLGDEGLSYVRENHDFETTTAALVAIVEAAL